MAKKKTTKAKAPRGYKLARPRARLSVGDAVRVTRELQGMTQSELAEASDIPQPTLSAIERDRVALGVERAVRLARALRVHPAVLLFPQWDVEKASA